MFHNSKYRYALSIKARYELLTFIDSNKNALGEELFQATKALIDAFPDDLLREITNKEKEFVEHLFIDTQALLKIALSTPTECDFIAFEKEINKDFKRYLYTIEACKKSEKVTVTGEVTKGIVDVAMTILSCVVSCIMSKSLTLSPYLSELSETLSFAYLRGTKTKPAAKARPLYEEMRAASRPCRSARARLFPSRISLPTELPPKADLNKLAADEAARDKETGGRKWIPRPTVLERTDPDRYFDEGYKPRS